jgi:hypothetical protein
MCICVLCLIVVPLPPGRHPSSVQLNNNNTLLWKTTSEFPNHQHHHYPRLIEALHGLDAVGKRKISCLSREPSHLLYRLSCSAPTRNIHRRYRLLRLGQHDIATFQYLLVPRLSSFISLCSLGFSSSSAANLISRSDKLMSPALPKFQ